MIKLLLNDEDINLNGTSFGGLPVKNTQGDFEWPNCESCELPMQF